MRSRTCRAASYRAFAASISIRQLDTDRVCGAIRRVLLGFVALMMDVAPRLAEEAVEELEAAEAEEEAVAAVAVASAAVAVAAVAAPVAVEASEEAVAAVVAAEASAEAVAVAADRAAACTSVYNHHSSYSTSTPCRIASNSSFDAAGVCALHAPVGLRACSILACKVHLGVRLQALAFIDDDRLARARAAARSVAQRKRRRAGLRLRLRLRLRLGLRARL